MTLLDGIFFFMECLSHRVVCVCVCAPALYCPYTHTHTLYWIETINGHRPEPPQRLLSYSNRLICILQIGLKIESNELTRISRIVRSWCWISRLTGRWRTSNGRILTAIDWLIAFQLWWYLLNRLAAVMKEYWWWWGWWMMRMIIATSTETKRWMLMAFRR